MIRLPIWRAVIFCACYIGLAVSIAAQTLASSTLDEAQRAPDTKLQQTINAPNTLEDVRRQLRAQQEQIENLRALIAQQTQLIDELRGRIERTDSVAHTSAQMIGSAKSSAKLDSVDTAAARVPHDASVPATESAPQTTQASTAQDARLARVEEQSRRTTDALAKQLGSITFSGDLRLQYDSIYNQLNSSPNASNPSILGNELTPRQRLRLRARLAMRGQINKEFDWGLRFATGSYPDVISTNQVLTDFYTRKPFALDQAYLTWSPQRVKGLRIQGGKFETPWTHTEMTFDNDINPEGLNESYTRNFKGSRLKNLTFVAWQLPFLERNPAFIRNADGTVNADASRRAGRDLALYGAQLRTKLEFNSKLALSLSAADLYFSGTQFITPVQYFGNQLQLPVTIVIPATASAPAQTLTAQATIAREQLVAGNGNLGLSIATNNATNRDGRLSSGFNLVDLIGRLDLAYSKKYPVAVLLNFVTNTQTRDVIANGASIRLSNGERNGYWAEVQVGKTKERGDLFFGYTFIRIEKDAVLTPFNWSDIAQQSDVRGQRIVFAYAADPRVTVSLTGIFTKRANGLLGVFGATPPGSLNNTTKRLQFETMFRF